MKEQDLERMSIEAIKGCDTELLTISLLKKLPSFKYKKVEIELLKAKIKHPNFPEDIFQMLAIMQEEAGEVAMAVNDYHSGKGSIEDVKEELAQTAAMCIRMLENL